MNINKLAGKYENLKKSIQRHSNLLICDNREITVENCREITSYDENSIELKLAKNIVKVVGLDMKMRNFTSEGVIITGKIQSITFEDII